MTTLTQSLENDLQLRMYRTRKINVILISGKAFAGKTVAAAYLTSLFNSIPGINVNHTALAKPIKDVASQIFGWDGIKDEKGRRLLQVIGTDAGRAYDVDIWVRKLEDYIYSTSIYPSNFVIIDDWRFSNERDFFLDKLPYEVTTIRIERPSVVMSGNTANHPSEVSLPSAEKEELVYNLYGTYNFAVFNDGTLDEFYKKLDSIYSYLATKIISYKEM